MLFYNSIFITCWCGCNLSFSFTVTSFVCQKYSTKFHFYISRKWNLTPVLTILYIFLTQLFGVFLLCHQSWYWPAILFIIQIVSKWPCYSQTCFVFVFTSFIIFIHKAQWCGIASIYREVCILTRFLVKVFEPLAGSARNRIKQHQLLTVVLCSKVITGMHMKKAPIKWLSQYSISMLNENNSFKGFSNLWNVIAPSDSTIL